MPTAALAQAAPKSGPDRFTPAPGVVSGKFVPRSLQANAKVNVIVEMAGDPVAVVQAKSDRKLSSSEKKAIRANLKAKQDAVSGDIAAKGGKVTAKMQSAYNGVAVTVSQGQVEALRALPGVVGVHSVALQTPDNSVAVPYLGVPSVWQDAGFTGKGVKVGVIDTGIDYTHADFGGPGTAAAWTAASASSTQPANPSLFGAGAPRVKGGYDFAGDGYRTLALAGDVTFTSSNRAPARAVAIRIIGDTVERTLTLNEAWKWLGAVKPTVLGAGKVAVLAPEGFMEAAVSENVFAGNAMNRRVSYQYGLLLPHGAKGEVDVGLGKAYPTGTSTLIAPTDIISKTGETRVIDGVQMEFQMVSGTEAPAEMTIYFPQFKALDSAEIACPLLHNILTLRGAQVRDAKKWATSLNELIALYGDKTDVVLAQHNWPKWEQENVVEFLANQRDLYEYLHDQTLRLTNHGYTGTEIAEMLKLPASLDQQWYTCLLYTSPSPRD